MVLRMNLFTGDRDSAAYGGTCLLEIEIVLRMVVPVYWR